MKRNPTVLVISHHMNERNFREKGLNKIPTVTSKLETQKGQEFFSTLTQHYVYMSQCKHSPSMPSPQANWNPGKVLPSPLTASSSEVQGPHNSHILLRQLSLLRLECSVTFKDIHLSSQALVGFEALSWFCNFLTPDFHGWSYELLVRSM